MRWRALPMRPARPGPWRVMASRPSCRPAERSRRSRASGRGPSPAASDRRRPEPFGHRPHRAARPHATRADGAPVRQGGRRSGSIRFYGHAFEPLNPMVPKETPCRRLVFAEPIGQLDDLKHVLNRLASALCAGSGAAGSRRAPSRSHFRARRSPQRGAAVGTAKATREARHLARLFDERLQSVDPGFGIEAAILVASKTEPLSAHQVEAQDFRSGDVTAVDLSRLVDRLGARLGPRRVYRLQPVESHIPERSVQRVPALAPDDRAGLARASAASGAPSRSSGAGHGHRLAARSSAGFLHLAARASSRDQGRRTGTHHGRMVAWRDEDDLRLRDYYRVEDETGARFWLFRDAPADQAGRWWLHGIFA